MNKTIIANTYVVTDESKNALYGFKGVLMAFIIIFHYAGIWHFPILIQQNITQYGRFAVDGFFVLTGLFATLSLLKIRNHPQPLRTFYLQRMARLLPLYYAFIGLAFIMIILLNHFQPSEKATQLLSDQWYFWFGLSNYLTVIQNKHVPFSLNICWYLAVIIQFYLIWPIIALKLNPRQIQILSLGCIVLAIITRQYMQMQEYSMLQIYHFSLARLDSLALGSFIAAGLVNGTKIIKLQLFSLVCLLTCLAYAIIDVNLVSYSIAALICSLLTLEVLRLNRILIKAFSISFLITPGKYSYFVYLAHIPIGMCCKYAAESIMPSMNQIFNYGLLLYSIIVCLFGAYLSATFFENKMAMIILKMCSKKTAMETVKLSDA